MSKPESGKKNNLPQTLSYSQTVATTGRHGLCASNVIGDHDTLLLVSSKVFWERVKTATKHAPGLVF